MLLSEDQTYPSQPLKVEILPVMLILKTLRVAEFRGFEKIVKINQFTLFLKVLGHVPVHMICQSKSPLLTDKWLKGFWNPSTYDRDIGNQS